jgi:hypothetical protein
MVSSNLILVDYGAAGVQLSKDSVDTISFHISGIPVTNYSGTKWLSWVDGSTLSAASSNTITDNFYSNQTVIVVPPATEWDYQVISSSNVAPVSVMISSIVPMGYFDIITDQENKALQKLTNVVISFTGNNPDVYGYVYLYKDTNTAAAFSNEEPVTNGVISTPGADISLTCNEQDQSISNTSPTRYWVAISITNENTAVYSNTIGLYVKALYGDGPDGGAIDQLYIVSNVSQAVSRVDDFRVSVTAVSIADTNSAYKARQTSYDHPLTAFNISSEDPDVEYVLEKLVDVYSFGSVDSDLGYIKLIQDVNGNEVYNPGVDTAVPGAIGTLSGNKVTLIPSVPLTMSGTNTYSFLILADISETAVISNSFNFIISNSNAFIFRDPYNDFISQRAQVTNAGTFPDAAPPQLDIVHKTSSTWDMEVVDYQVNEISSFISNQEIWVCYFDITADVERLPVEEIDTITVSLDGELSALSGSLKVYMTDTASSSVTYGSSLTTNTFSGGSNVLVISNAAITPSTDPDNITSSRIWITLKADSFSLDEKAIVSITNIAVTGRDNGVILSIEDITNAVNPVFNLNLHEVYVSVSNFSNTWRSLHQGTFDNELLTISISNVDRDATNFLSQLSITNLGSAGASDYGNLKLYFDNGNGSFSATEDTLLGNAVLNGENRFDVVLSPPVALSSNNASRLFATVDIKLDAGTETFVSLRINNASAFTFSDEYTDEFDQRPVVNMSGSQPVTQLTNPVTPAQAQPWDFRITSVQYDEYETIPTNLLVPVTKISLYQDIELTNLTVLSNVSVKTFSIGTKADIYGTGYLYLESGVDTYSFSPAEDTNLIGQADIISGSDFSVSILYSNVSINPNSPTELWLVIKQTNASDNVFSNTIGFIISGVGGDGANSGTIANTELFNTAVTNIFRVDNFAADVLWVSNITLEDRIKVGSTFNPAMSMKLRGKDPDGITYVKELSLYMTGSSTATADMIPGVLLYQDMGAAGFDKDEDLIKATAGFSGIKSDLVMTSPIVISNTNEVILYVAYNTELNDNNAGKVFGIAMPGASNMSTVDLWSDGIDQTGYFTIGSVEQETNITLIP